MGRKLLGQLLSADADRHDHVGEQQRDAFVMRVPGGEGFESIACLEDFVAIFFQAALDDGAHGRFVLDEENGFRPTGHGALIGARVACGRGAARGRQVDLEGRALPELALHFDPALMLFDDAVNGGESQTGALAKFLRGKERLEEAAQGHIVHAQSAVGDGERDESSGPSLGRVALDVGRLNLRDAGGDHDLPAARHGVARVDCEVENDLLDHSAIRGDGREIRAILVIVADVVAECARQQAAQAGDDFVKVEDARRHHAAAAEGQQLARELPGAFGGTGDLLHAVARGLAERLIGAQQSAMSQDDGEDIVEIMRDARRQPSDGFELLRVAQLCFELLPVGDVGDVTVNDLALANGKEGPREGPPACGRLDARELLSRSQTGADERGDFGRQHFRRMIVADGFGHLHGGFVEVSQRGVAGESEHRVGIELGKCSK